MQKEQIISIGKFQKLLNALCILKLMVQGEKDIQEGKGRKQADVFDGVAEAINR